MALLDAAYQNLQSAAQDLAAAHAVYSKDDDFDLPSPLWESPLTKSSFDLPPPPPDFETLDETPVTKTSLNLIPPPPEFQDLALDIASEKTI